LATGKPFIIENVPGAPLINPLTLCGTMFGLKVKRHRLFELHGFEVWFLPATCACKGKVGYTAASDGFSSFANKAKLISVAGHNFCVKDAKQAMQIDWMPQSELSQAIPPIYAEFLGKQLINALAIDPPLKYQLSQLCSVGFLFASPTMAGYRTVDEEVSS